MTRIAEVRLKAAAVGWWELKRPLEWDMDEHLANPEINCNSDREKALARCVADVVRDSNDEGDG